MSTEAEQYPELIDRFSEFLKVYHRDDIGELAQKFPNDQRALEISVSDLFAFDPDLADDLHESPEQILEHAESALAEYPLPVDVDLSKAEIRVTDLNRSNVYTVGEYRTDDVNTLIGIKGIVNKATDVLPRIEEAAFICQRCGTPNYEPQSAGFQEPHECSGCERDGPYTIDYDESRFHDYRLVRLQEPPDEATGDTGSTVDVILEKELVEQVQPGDRVVIPGVLRIEQQETNGRKDRTFGLYADAQGVDILDTDFTDMDITDEDETKIKEVANSDNPYQLLIDSFAPGIQGYQHVKEGLLLELFGGVNKELKDGSVERGIIHNLMIGDPGTGKSSLLRYATEISPRSVMTSGKGSSSAGLTAAAVRDDFGPGGEWSIEGGAIVKADQGVAGIDELDKMDESDRQSLHEALEHMEVNVAKAGMNPTLSARTNVIAAANPVEGRFDKYAPISEQIDLDPALISRFDLIYTFTDEVDEERDAVIAAHNTTRWADGLKREREQFTGDETAESEPDLPQEFVRKYIAFAKEIVPKATPEAQDKVEEEFTKLRQANDADEDEPVPVTWRKQEAMHRLAEASARVRLSETIEVRDVMRAVRLINKSLEDVGLDPDTGKLDADILETGQSKSQRDRMQQLKSIIKELQKEIDDWGVPIQDVVDILVENGIDSGRARDDIESLKQKGEAYEPEDGKIALT